MGRLKFIDGLRGIAAVLVMLQHLVSRTDLSIYANRGYLGVAIFFVLSGFVIAMVMGTERMSAAYLGRFALRRSIRLDIPYWVNIALALAMMALAARIGVQKTDVSTAQVLAHMVYLQNVLGFEEISPVYWTLCLEVQFYLALALMLWAAQIARVRWETFLVLFLGTLAASVLIHIGWLPAVPGLMFSYWWAFGLGAVCYWTAVGRIVPGYFVIICVGLLYSGFEFHGDWRLTGVATACLIFIAWRSNAMERWLSSAPFQFLGRISYSLYLCHPLIGWSAQSFALTRFTPYVALGVGMVASIASAWVTSVVIEKPAIRLSHRVSLRRTNYAVRRATRASTVTAPDP